jgi:hypothetical protein
VETKINSFENFSMFCAFIKICEEKIDWYFIFCPRLFNFLDERTKLIVSTIMDFTGHFRKQQSPEQESALVQQLSLGPATPNDPSSVTTTAAASPSKTSSSSSQARGHDRNSSSDGKFQKSKASSIGSSDSSESILLSPSEEPLNKKGKRKSSSKKKGASKMKSSEQDTSESSSLLPPSNQPVSAPANCWQRFVQWKAERAEKQRRQQEQIRLEQEERERKANEALQLADEKRRQDLKREDDKKRKDLETEEQDKQAQQETARKEIKKLEERILNITRGELTQKHDTIVSNQKKLQQYENEYRDACINRRLDEAKSIRMSIQSIKSMQQMMLVLKKSQHDKLLMMEVHSALGDHRKHDDERAQIMKQGESDISSYDKALHQLQDQVGNVLAQLNLNNDKIRETEGMTNLIRLDKPQVVSASDDEVMRDYELFTGKKFDEREQKTSIASPSATVDLQAIVVEPIKSPPAIPVSSPQSVSSSSLSPQSQSPLESANVNTLVTTATTTPVKSTIALAVPVKRVQPKQALVTV